MKEIVSKEVELEDMEEGEGYLGSHGIVLGMLILAVVFIPVPVVKLVCIVGIVIQGLYYWISAQSDYEYVIRISRSKK